MSDVLSLVVLCVFRSAHYPERTMSYARSRIRNPHPEPSYFRRCKYCGQRIHLRHMPEGQWVAFDGPDTVHKCPQQSQYEDLQFPRHRGYRRGVGYSSTPSAPDNSSTTPTGGSQLQEPRPVYTSFWFWVALAFFALYLLN